MEKKILSLYNVINIYNCSLLQVLDKIDDSILRALKFYEKPHTEELLDRKYEFSLEMADAIHSYVHMLHIAETIAKKFDSYDGCQLEKARRSSVSPRGGVVVSAESETRIPRDSAGLERPEKTDESPEKLDLPKAELACAIKTKEGSESISTVGASESNSDQLEVEVKSQNNTPILTPRNSRLPVRFQLRPKKQAGLAVPRPPSDANTASHGQTREDGKSSTNKSSRGSRRLPTEQSSRAVRHVEKSAKVKCFLEDDLRVGENCFFCHVVSPAEFYLCSNQGLLDSLETSLTEDLNAGSANMAKKYKTKEDASVAVGNFCCGYISARKKWLRIQVLDWMMHNPEDVFVQLIDYGESIHCSYSVLKPMTDFYLAIPKMAVKCHLAGIYSPHPGGQWSKASVDFFKEISQMRAKMEFKLIYVHKEGDSSGVDLVRVDSCDDIAVGVMMVNSGSALQLGASEDSAWNPIDGDDLEEFDNINEAIAGYDAQDEARICRFTDESGTKCFKGASCKLEHGRLSQDGITTDKILTPSFPLMGLPLPRINDHVKILVTGYINSCHFYAHIVTNPSQGCYFNKEFKRLQDAMNANNLVQTYQPFKVFPGIAELVLVKEDSEWSRGKCRAFVRDDIFEIFLVDFGFTKLKRMRDLRQMKEDFLHVPFQAVECILSNCQEKSDVSREKSFGFFKDCMGLHEFNALVVDNTLPLKLQLWDMDGTDMAYVIQEYGLGEERFSDFFPQSTVLVCN